MEYTKPELSVLGTSQQVMLSQHIKNGTVSEGVVPRVNPAYDLDE